MNTSIASSKVPSQQVAAPVQGVAFSIVRKDRQFAMLSVPGGNDNGCGAPA